nr:N-acetylmuramoyl-L-alanine amidase [Oceanococcus sp. HetDA_MAG_MS8]
MRMVTWLLFRRPAAVVARLAVLCLWVSTAQAANLHAIQTSQQEAGTTAVELTFDEPVQWRWFRLQDPHRVVLDIHAAQIGNVAPKVGGMVRNMRFGRLDDGLRVVLDLDQQPGEVRLASTQSTALTVMLDSAEPEPEPEPAVQAAIEQDAETVAPTPVITAVQRPVVVVVDPGHGGKDPGAIGPSGLREAHVALSIARILREELQRYGGYQVVLTRDSDVFLPLRERIRVAREAGADLFVSIHADAFDDHRAHGSSVYVLSHRGASSEHARLLARRENEADLVGGVQLQSRDETLAAVLLDISMNAALDASTDIASRVLQGLETLGPVHKSSVQRAGFVVLKAPDVPSILVETAFISNPREERQLGSYAHRQRLAQTLAGGIRDYFREYRPAQLVAGDAPAEHLVRSGETLSEIAQQYGLSVGDLRRSNSLVSDRIRVGQRLRLPLQTAARL